MHNINQNSEIINAKKVSIIIPCYNQGQYISEAIESALNQTYNNIEIVCYNDGSSDNSSEVIAKYAQKYNNIIFIDSKENKGVIQARNTAIESCNGEYILPLDADDKIDATYIEKAAKILDTMPNVGIVYCKAEFFGAKTGEWPIPPYDSNKIVYFNCIFNCSLFRKTDFEMAGGYKDYMTEGLEDWDLWLSLIEQGLDVYRIDEVLFAYRQQQEKTRNDIPKEIEDKLFKLILTNHLNLYLKNPYFTNKIFSSHSVY